MHLLEKIGFILIIASVVFLLLEPFTENALIQKLAGEQSIVFMLGLGVWAFGVLMRQSKEAKEKKAK